MWRDKNKTRSGGLQEVVPVLLAIILAFAFVAMPGAAAAQPSTSSLWDFFGDGVGDPYSSVFLNQMFGPLFPSVTNASSQSIFAQIVAYFNVIVLLIGGLMFFYNVTVGVMQSAHEGQVLGQRWSSLWAPLRLVFAVGMLVPVNQGYNLAQSGVAYIVQGSTKMASAVWGTTASAVISGDLPIAAPVINFDPELMAALYDQAACVSTLERQVNGANSSAHVVRREASNEHFISNTTVINNGVNDADQGICGSWTTPNTPEYLLNIVENVTAADSDQPQEAVRNASIAEGKARQLIDDFRNGHKAILDNAYAGMLEITEANYAQISTSSVPPASVGPQIAAVHTAANNELTDLVNAMREKATSDDFGVSRARDNLLRRINGGDGCFSETGISGASEGREAMVGCYGEGWMGAGSWYILMAKLNNELSSLSEAVPNATKPGYSSVMGNGGNASDIYHSANGSGFWRRNFTSGDTAGMPSRVETLAILGKYGDLFQTSSLELASFDYKLPTSMVAEINADANGSTGDFWEKVVGGTLNSMTRGFMDIFDPGKGGQDPMVGLIGLGHNLIHAGSAILVATAATGFFTGGGAAVALLPVYSILLSAGVSLSFIMPIMPFLYWVLAISGYFLLITEAIVAVNLWALSHLRMDGEGISGEAGRQGWLMVLALFMTPTLMVFGFIIGMLIFRIVSDLISAGLFYATSSIVGTSPIIWLFGTIGYTILTVTAYGLLLERSFSLVSEFPGRVMKWMGSEVQIGGGEGMIKGAAAAGAVGVNTLGNQLEQGMGKPGANGKFVKGVGIGGKLRVKGEQWRNRKGASEGS